MKFNRTTKSALFTSVVSLFLCFAMLLGTTFAWFTDSATSANNKIVAGTLDVQLWMYNGTEYVNIGDDATPIFGEASGLAQNNAKDTLWEPGKTQVVYLKIVNNGSLDLKYNVAINVRDTADDKNLYEVLEYAIDADAKATDAKLPVWDGGKKVIVGNNVDTTDVEIPAKEDGSNAHEHYFALSVHMLEEAGNEYQGGYVEFDIKVAATQVNTEADSFGTDYDVDAIYPEVSVPEKLPETGSATVNMTLETESTTTLLSTDVLNNILDKTDAKTLATVHETPVIDVDNKKVSVNNFEIVDENGDIVDLKAMNNDKPVTVTIEVGNAFAVGETVVVYHDDEVVASAAVSAEKTITYTVTHFCDIVVSTGDGKVDSLPELEAALANGGNVKLEENVTLNETLTIPENVFATLDLNGKKISGATSAAILVNNGTLTIVGGTIENTALNGGSTISNKGTLVLDGANVVGAPIAGDSGYPAYCISNSGNLTVEEGTTVSADRGCLYLSGTGETVINGGTFTNNDIYEKLNGRSFTSHVVVVGYGANNKLTINGGSFNHFHTTTSGGVVINNWSAVTVDVNGGNFSGGNYFGKWDNLSDYGYGSTKTPFAVKGGTFTGMDSNYVADGYKASKVGDLYYVTETNANFVVDTDGLVAAINDPDITKVYLANGEYALRFTNQVGFNVDGMEFVGAGDDVKLSITSTEVWYGRVQGDGVTFENIHFISTVGATGKAVYNNCVFDSWAICASSGNMKTYYNDCTIKECLNTSSDFSSGNVYVNDSVVTKAEYSFSSDSSAMYFENCEIGEIIPWDANTVLQGCKIEKLVTENMVNNEIITITEDDNGVLYSTTTADENVLTLYRVPADYAETTFNVPAGVTSIGGYAFAYNDNVKTVVLASTVRELGRGFDSSKVEKVVLNEGLTTISARAFRSTPNLQEVVISSTVTTIADNAFQKSGVKTITIPANVKTVGEAAFGASKIETVIFEGNTKIEGYAFRGCPNLRTVYLNGMDVNFVASSLNGRNSMWFCNSESNNPNTSNITFYVKTDVIKERVLTAMGAERNNTTVIVEMTTEEGGYITDSEGNAFAYDAPALDDALADGKNVTLAGNLTFNSNETSANSGYGATGVTVNGSVLDGNGYSLGINNWDTWDSAINITGGTIKNLTVNNGMRGIFINHNSTNCGKVYLENVVIDGTVYTISCDQGTNSGLEAKNSTFNGWTSYAATIGDVKFVDCSFGEGQGYAFCRPYAPTEFVGCDFEAGFEIDPRAAVTFENCTIDGVALTAENLATLVTSNIANASVK